MTKRRKGEVMAHPNFYSSYAAHQRAQERFRERTQPGESQDSVIIDAEYEQVQSDMKQIEGK